MWGLVVLPAMQSIVRRRQRSQVYAVCVNLPAARLLTKRG
jgi:hypothetical protein